jgi:hypothetical protein
MSHALVQAPRWLLLTTLIYAPWAYGCTRPWSVLVLDGLLGAVLALWLAGCAVRRSWPAVHPVLLGAAAWLVLQAWWMALNAKFDYPPGAIDPEPLSPWLGWAPGSINRSLSLPATWHITALLGAGCFACDLASRPRWRKRLWWTMALAGVSVIVLGLAQKLTRAPGIFWRAEGHGDIFFATFRYHANAGAFINLIWPLVGGLLVLSFRREERLWKRIAWAAALVVCLAGAFVNTSRASSLIALAMVGLWLGWMVCRAVRGRAEMANAPVVVGLALGLTAMVIALFAFGGFEASLRRWGQLKGQLDGRNARLLVPGVCVKMLPKSGVWGFGPGTFRTAFPYFTHHLGNELAGVWLYAHQDYLQTLVEWGWVGAAVWCMLVFGGLGYAGWVRVRRGEDMAGRDRFFFTASAGALLPVLAHGMVDFPLQVASIQLYVAVLLGAMWSCRTWVAEAALPQAAVADDMKPLIDAHRR